MIAHVLNADRVAPLSGGGRGLKPRWADTVAGDPAVAPLSGGGRGLKQCPAWHAVHQDVVAPLSGGGRGLKHLDGPSAWIVGRRSSLRRGAWIETTPAVGSRRHSVSRSSLRRGAWIETRSACSFSNPFAVAPLSGGGRGLKPDRCAALTRSGMSLLSPEGGVD